MLCTVAVIVAILLHGVQMKTNPGAALLREIQIAQLQEAAREKEEVHMESLDKLEKNGEVLIEGVIRGRMDIDLKCQGGSFCIPLHISVRPREQAFVFNAMYMNGVYDIEERRLFFLARDSFLKISIVNLETHFEILINDHHYKNFDHRMSPDLIKQLQIRGRFDVKLVEIFRAN